MTTRRGVMTTAVAIGTGSIAARLARLEAMVPTEPDGDPVVLMITDLDGNVTYPNGGTVGKDTFLIHLTYREDGPR